ncbi:MAG: GNAT family N-acetyltransferase [Saprospiraceae bacterium]|nr:GNAT family N-acetyltransferase [Saprospiraceae bacterium]
MTISIDKVIGTDKYLLRLPNERDIDFIFSATQFPGFNDFMQWDAPDSKKIIVQNLRQTIQKWKIGTEYNFTIVNKIDENQRLGRISIRKTGKKNIWHLGYWTHPLHQGKGVMTEAVASILGFGFNTLLAKEIRSRYAIQNKASEKVLFKNGFRFLKHLERGFQKEGIWIRENELRIKRKEWSARSKSQSTDCTFCKTLIDHPHTLFENENIIAILDADPITVAHIIICPKNHITDFHLLPDEILLEIMQLAKKYVKALNKIFQPKGYSMMINGGKYNDIKHMHLHIFPRFSQKDFRWVYNEHLPKEASKFEVVKKLLEGHLS